MKENKYASKVIGIKDIDAPCPNLKNVDKTNTIAEWIINWIESALSKNKIQHNDILPSKADFAYLLGVSVGTIQNAIRAVEDRGYLVSKQKIGTAINVNGKNTDEGCIKLTSKRDLAMEAIKKYLKENNFAQDSVIPSTRKLSEILEISLNTLRSAVQGLVAEGILAKNEKQEFVLLSTDYEVSEAESETLVDKIRGEIESYITNNCKISDKLPTNAEFAKKYNVGIKTIHDAISDLVKSGVLVTLRGSYGTLVANMPGNSSQFEPLRETSIFAPAAQTAYYYYEKTQQRIKRMISESYYPGSKLPPILELAKLLDLSPNTVRRAIKELTKEGILTSAPGRWGGTFVIANPAQEEPSYQWIAVSSDYIAADNDSDLSLQNN